MPKLDTNTLHKITWKDWFFATRPKTLTASLIPVLAGTILAKVSGYQISLTIALFAFLSTISIQIGTNIINDALDFKKGADSPSRIGTMRITQIGLMKGFLSVKQVSLLGFAFFLAAFLFGLPLIAQGGTYIFCLLILSICLGYIYTGGPFPLAYVGLSDFFVILFFGIISSSVCFYLQTFQITVQPILAGLQIGLLATVILAINNLRDCRQDTLVGKNTLAVLFGENFARWEITVCQLLPFALNLIWLQWNFTLAALLPLLVLPTAIVNVISIWKTEIGPIYNNYLAMAAFVHMIFGTLFVIGLLSV